MTYYDFMAKWLPQLFMQDREAFERDASKMFMKSRTTGYDAGVARATRALDELEAIAGIIGCDN
jgi:hypothetical protein